MLRTAKVGDSAGSAASRSPPRVRRAASWTRAVRSSAVAAADHSRPHPRAQSRDSVRAAGGGAEGTGGL